MAKYLAVLFILAVLGFVCPGQAAISEPYYVNATWTDHSLQGLKTLVGEEFTMPFKIGVFDCGERSAYLEWLLQCHGFDAGFCMDGSGPWTVPAGAGYSTHIWVTAALYNDTTGVYTGRVYIETTSTPIQIIVWGDEDWDKYARLPDNEVYGMKNFLSIYDIMAGITPNTNDDDPVAVEESELDWWKFGTDLTRKPEQKKIRCELLPQPKGWGFRLFLPGSGSLPSGSSTVLSEFSVRPSSSGAWRIQWSQSQAISSQKIIG